MKVKELIEALQKMPQDIPVARWVPPCESSGYYIDEYADEIDEVLSPEAVAARHLDGGRVVLL
jgi:hypothetical protein